MKAKWHGTISRSASSPHSPTAASWPLHLLSTSAHLDTFLRRHTRLPVLADSELDRLSIRLARMPCCRRAIPIVHHLRRQNRIEHKSCNEAIQNKLVVNLLQRREYATRTPEQIIEHSERAQLPRPALTIHGQDLRELARDRENTGPALQQLHLLVRNEGIRDDKRVDGGGDGCDKRARRRGFVLILEDEDADDDILCEDEGGLAVGAEGEGGADVVGEGDDEGGGFEDVGGEGEAGGGGAASEFEDLRDLHNAGSGDDGDSEGFGDGEGEAFRVGDYIEVEEEGAVAGRAEERDDCIVDGCWEGGGDGFEERMERIEDFGLNEIHAGGCMGCLQVS
jgi:hypothetical protein